MIKISCLGPSAAKFLTLCTFSVVSFILATTYYLQILLRQGLRKLRELQADRKVTVLSPLSLFFLFLPSFFLILFISSGLNGRRKEKGWELCRIKMMSSAPRISLICYQFTHSSNILLLISDMFLHACLIKLDQTIFVCLFFLTSWYLLSLAIPHLVSSL